MTNYSTAHRQTTQWLIILKYYFLWIICTCYVVIQLEVNAVGLLQYSSNASQCDVTCEIMSLDYRNFPAHHNTVELLLRTSLSLVQI